MPNSTIRLLVDLTINPGALAAFQDVARQMIAGSRKEPGTLGFEWFLSADQTTCRIIETYANSNAVYAHLSGPVVTDLFPKLLQQAKIDRFQVCGNPTGKALAKLESSKAAIFNRWQGFSR
jgi:quinol monooxygenase YgiN